MKQICSKCLTLQDEYKKVYKELMPCTCNATRYSYHEDELEDFEMEAKDLATIFGDLSKRERTVVAYFMKGGS